MASSASVILRTKGTAFRVFGLASACLLSFCFASACRTSCGTGNQTPIVYADGLRNDSHTYESTAYEGEWLHYPSQRRFEFPHNLGTTNYQIQAFVAFSARPVASDGLSISDIAVASGDILVIEQKTENTLRVRNDTCSEEYLHIRVTADPTDTDAGL
jgi:hypothetical protein